MSLQKSLNKTYVMVYKCGNEESMKLYYENICHECEHACERLTKTERERR